MDLAEHTSLFDYSGLFDDDNGTVSQSPVRILHLSPAASSVTNMTASITETHKVMNQECLCSFIHPIGNAFPYIEQLMVISRVNCRCIRYVSESEHVRIDAVTGFLQRFYGVHM
jgi:hypothetical protein